MGFNTHSPLVLFRSFIKKYIYNLYIIYIYILRTSAQSLGGKAKTCIIATLSPSQSACEESLSTLDYAFKARCIKNQPTVNQKLTKKVVLKEYCAEIETLRAQLQITREKNGLYVDPAEYYGMEARISTQELQLTECEGALRVRNDEVKKLRSEREGVEEQLEVAKRDLEETSTKLEIVDASLEKATVDLETATVELRATEAVVVEQSETEGQLHQQGSDLIGQVMGRRNDVEKLLAKVGRLAEKEATRRLGTETFVAELGGRKDDLLVGVNEMLTHSKQQSADLCEGVAEMLTKGRDTCASLKGSIEEALHTLIGDAEVARDSMSTSCTGTHYLLTRIRLFHSSSSSLYFLMRFLIYIAHTTKPFLLLLLLLLLSCCLIVLDCA